MKPVISISRLKLLVTFVAASLHAHAADRDTGSAATDTDTVKLGLLEVTGKHLTTEASSGVLGSQRLVDTPYSITVVDRQALDQHQATTLGEAFFGDASVVAEMNPHASGWGSPLSVRGIEVAWDGYRLNGAPTDGWGFEWPFEILEQIELLKGATGFMYGFGSPGGIVNYRTKKPTDGFLATTTVGWRSDSVFTAALDLGDRVGRDGGFGYRVNLAEENGGTYNGGDIDRFVGAFAFDARINKKLTVTGEAIHLDRKLENEAPEYAFWSYTGTTLPEPVKGSTDRSLDGTFWNIDYTVVSTSLAYQASPDWKATVDYTFSTKRNDTNKTWAYLTDASGDYTLYAYQLGGDEHRNFAQAMLEGRIATGPVIHQVVAGASLQNTRTYSSSYDWATAGSGNLYTGHAEILPFVPHSKATAFSGETSQAAFFVSDTAQLRPGLSLLGGLRYNHYEQRSGASTYEKDPVTPTVALIYHPRSDSTLYASYVESLDQGGTVSDSSGGIPYTNAGEMLAPLVSKQYEIGAKVERTAWTASLALFRLEKGAEIDQQNADSSLTRVQDGIHLYQGLDLSAGVRLASDLTLTGGVLWLDATYDQLSPSNATIEGHRTTGSSRIQAVVQAAYQIRALPGLELHAGVRRFGDSYYDEANTLLLPDYTLVNAGAGYTTRVFSRPLTCRFDVSNLTDKKYWSNAGLGTPITVAFSAKLVW